MQTGDEILYYFQNVIKPMKQKLEKTLSATTTLEM